MSEKEKVGETFREDALRSAQNRAWESLRVVASRLKPGNSEKDASLILKEVLKEYGVEKIWHPPQIRFGVNTTKAFGKLSEPETLLRADDLFFLDIGPVFFGHEGDVGETYVIGNNPDHHRIAQDARKVFSEVSEEWKRTGKSGQELYDFAVARAEEKGWRLSPDGASGHRVSEFPHAVHYRGKLKTFEGKPTPNRWILEIHLIEPSGKFGAFFEDLL